MNLEGLTEIKAVEKTGLALKELEEIQKWLGREVPKLLYAL